MLSRPKSPLTYGSFHKKRPHITKAHVYVIYIYIYIDFSRHSIVADTILYTKKTILGANIGKFRIVVTQNRCVREREREREKRREGVRERERERERARTREREKSVVIF